MIIEEQMWKMNQNIENILQICSYVFIKCNNLKK